MGCDIHQYNLIWQNDRYHLEGEGVFNSCQASKYKSDDLDEVLYADWIYKSDFIPEIIQGRNYSLFGILAGVRSSEFEIEDKNVGCPDKLFQTHPSDELFKRMTEDRHSYTWYWLPQLKAGLVNASHEIVKTICWTKMKGYKEETKDFEWIKEDVQRMLRCLDRARENLGSLDSFNRSIIFFNFDS